MEKLQGKQKYNKKAMASEFEKMRKDMDNLKRDLIESQNERSELYANIGKPNFNPDELRMKYRKTTLLATFDKVRKEEQLTTEAALESLLRCLIDSDFFRTEDDIRKILKNY